MWIVRWFVIAAVIVFILLFSLQNQEMQVRMYLFGWESPLMPLYFALFIAFVVGIFVWFIVAAFQILHLRGDLRDCRRENKALQKELTALRNLPLEENLGEADDFESPPGTS